MSLRVGVTAGLYTIGRATELATPVRKIGYIITRGADFAQMDLDVAHEVTYTAGRETRHIMKKQGILVSAHGDLNVPIGIPERADYRDCLERMKLSVRSAVFLGANYVDFHGSLNQWLELLSHTSQKQAMAWVDHEGRHISKILSENEKLREWFIEKFFPKAANYLYRDIMSPKDIQEKDLIAEKKVKVAAEKLENEIEKINDKIDDIKIELRPLAEKNKKGELTEDEVKKADTLAKSLQELQLDSAKKTRDLQNIKARDYDDEAIPEYLEIKMKNPDPKKRVWYQEDMQGVGPTLLQAHVIMFHYLFYQRDPIFLAMAEQYKDLLQRYKIDYNKKEWPTDAYVQGESDHEKEFKEFFYAVVTAKYLEGLLKGLIKWIDEEFIKIELPKFVKSARLEDPEKEKQELDELVGYAKNIIFAIENQEARNIEHAGMHLMWRPKQIYAAVKTIRKTLKTQRVWIIVDHEHIATQGVDALLESREMRATIPDYGYYVIAIHANHPNPLHLHDPVDHGDNLLYELLYNLRMTGFGRKRECYIVFERGGGREQQDPFERSVDALKVMAELLEKDTDPKKLPLSFYGLENMMGDEQRQWAIIQSHKMEPIKDLLELPEEEWSFLSRAARDKQRPEAFKKGEFR